MGTEETFRKGVEKIKAGWPTDRITSDETNKLVIQCENGAYLVYRRMELPDKLKDSEAYELLHGKVMIQFTEDLSATAYRNVSKVLMGTSLSACSKRIQEALREFGMRVQIGSTLL